MVSDPSVYVELLVSPVLIGFYRIMSEVLPSSHGNEGVSLRLKKSATDDCFQNWSGDSWLVLRFPSLTLYNVTV